MRDSRRASRADRHTVGAGREPVRLIAGRADPFDERESDARTAGTRDHGERQSGGVPQHVAEAFGHRP